MVNSPNTFPSKRQKNSGPPYSVTHFFFLMLCHECKKQNQPNHFKANYRCHNIHFSFLFHFICSLVSTRRVFQLEWFYWLSTIQVTQGTFLCYWCQNKSHAKTNHMPLFFGMYLASTVHLCKKYALQISCQTIWLFHQYWNAVGKKKSQPLL